MPSNRIEAISVWKQTLLIGSVVLALFLVIALLAEGAMRLHMYIKHGSGNSRAENIFHYDEAIDLRVLVPGAEFRGNKINQAGFRGPTISVEKPDDVLRVAFLGGSTTICSEVRNDALVWPHKVTDTLATRYPAQKFDFINGGVPGYTAEQSRKNLLHKVAAYKPDLIVIYHATNDLSTYSRDEAKAQNWKGKHGDVSTSWIANYSVLAYLVEKNLTVWRAQSKAIDNISGGGDGLTLDIEPVVAPFRASLTKLVEEAKKVATEVAVVTFSTHIRADQSADKKAEAAVTSLYYMPYMTLDGLVNHFAAYNRTIAEVGKASGVLVIDGEDTIPGTTEYFHDSVHFTTKGSLAQAERVSNALLTNGVIERMLVQ